ncbi:MAG TPA: YetF domain-containing protein [Thermomicrobiales bacterium]
MGWIVDVDWGAVFRPNTPILETFVRGSVMYLGLFFLLRAVLKREAGAVGITDLLVIVLLADAAQNAMADDYRSIPDGLLLVGTVVFWAYALDWLGYRFPHFQRIIHPRALLLVRDGRLLRKNMERELITEEELHQQLRLRGVSDLALVREAYLEGDGRISVITNDEQSQDAPERPTP